VSGKLVRGLTIITAFAAFVAFLLAAPGGAAAERLTAGRAHQVTPVGEIRIPTTGADGAAAQDIVCFVDIRDPFLRPDALVGTLVNVSCTEEMFSIYAEVAVIWDGAVYQPSIRSDFSVLSVQLPDTPSGGAPCNTGSTYYGITYVEVVAQNGLGNSDEFSSLNGLVC
jgi:hypothetical protein